MMPMDLDAIERRFEQDRQQMDAEDRARYDRLFAMRHGPQRQGLATLEPNAPTLTTEYFDRR